MHIQFISPGWPMHILEIDCELLYTQSDGYLITAAIIAVVSLLEQINTALTRVCNFRSGKCFYLAAPASSGRSSGSTFGCQSN